MKTKPTIMKTNIKTLLTLSAFAGLTFTTAQAATVYLGNANDMDSASAWSGAVPGPGNEATISVSSTGTLPRWQANYAATTTINQTAGDLSLDVYNSFGSSVNTDFIYNMSGGSFTTVGSGGGGAPGEFNVNQHTFNLSGGSVTAQWQFRLLNTGIMNLSGTGTLDAPTIAGTAGTMNFETGWTGSATIDDLDESGWETLLATTLAGSTFDGVDITTANFSDNFVVDGNTLSLAVVPEPSSTALLGLGGLALMLRRRRS